MIDQQSKNKIEEICRKEKELAFTESQKTFNRVLGYLIGFEERGILQIVHTIESYLRDVRGSKHMH